MKDVIRRFVRIDERTLGCFRMAFGLALIGDLLHRWDWIRAFYTNDGVLPNHNHLFQYRESGGVWSFFHSFSNEGEATAGFLVMLVIYLMFTVGFKTKAAQVVSLVGLVSLAGRNTLLDSHGSALGIAVLALTLPLPLGKRLSVDRFFESFESPDELLPSDLNRPIPITKSDPTLAATLVWCGLAIALVSSAMLQTGAAWKDGTALHYALHVDRYVSATGVAIRDGLSPGMGSIWTKGLRLAEFAVVPLALVPVARKMTRPIAMVLLAFYALTFVILFRMGLYGWTLLAMVALLIPAEFWDGRKQGTRPVTVVYDDDCGICHYIARLVHRLDSLGNVTFIGSSGRTGGITYHDEAGATVAGFDQAFPTITPKLTNETMLVIDKKGHVHTENAAVTALFGSLTFLWRIDAAMMKLPGISSLVRLAYRRFAARRTDVSIALGLGSCALPTNVVADDPAPSIAPRTGAEILWGQAKIVIGSVLSVLVVLTMAAQTGKRFQALPFGSLASQATLTDAASWARMTGAWDVWAPEPPRENGVLIVEGETKEGSVMDLLTGYPPDLELVEPRRARRGVLWATYSERIREKKYEPFKKELRRYLQRGGYALANRNKRTYVKRFTAYWVKKPIAAPGAPDDGKVEREQLMQHGTSRRAPTIGKQPPKRIIPKR